MSVAVEGCFYHVLFEDPFVGVTRTGYELPFGVSHTAKLAGGRTAYLLITPCWHLPHQLEHLLEVRAATLRDHPNIHFILMAATPEDDKLLREAGVDTFVCNHNALLDERLYFPEPAERRFDAVYTGRLEPMKRHELAFQVPRMAVISGEHGVEPEYARQLMDGYGDLAWCNYGDDGLSLIDAAAVRGILNQSRCGLALSALEGAMYASAEYLLCGLPVVSTASEGGRDVFFHPDYVTLVDETPAAVAKAVAAYRENAPDPMMIRRRTLELFKPHRARLLMRLSAIVQRNLFPSADDNLWAPNFVNQFRHWVQANGG